MEVFTYTVIFVVAFIGGLQTVDANMRHSGSGVAGGLALVTLALVMAFGMSAS